MNYLGEYVNSFPKDKQQAIRQKIAKALGISEIYVISMCNGNRKVPKKYAVDIHKVTGGAVPFHVINPKLTETFAELMSLIGNTNNLDRTITPKP